MRYLPPLRAKKEVTRSLPHLENECQLSINNLMSRIMGNLGGA